MYQKIFKKKQLRFDYPNLNDRIQNINDRVPKNLEKATKFKRLNINDCVPKNNQI